jgi:hypothetical protein
MAGKRSDEKVMNISGRGFKFLFVSGLVFSSFAYSSDFFSNIRQKADS